MTKVPGNTNGYEHNYVIDGGGKNLVLAARVFNPATGRSLEVFTDQPGVLLYTANGLNGHIIGKYGWAYGPFAGFCLETQHYPDSVNHPNFPTTLLRPGERLKSTTIYRFTAK